VKYEPSKDVKVVKFIVNYIFTAFVATLIYFMGGPAWAILLSFIVVLYLFMLRDLIDEVLHHARLVRELMDRMGRS
jgi:hypothetical protein